MTISKEEQMILGLTRDPPGRACSPKRAFRIWRQMHNSDTYSQSYRCALKIAFCIAVICVILIPVAKVTSKRLGHTQINRGMLFLTQLRNVISFPTEYYSSLPTGFVSIYLLKVV